MQPKLILTAILLAAAISSCKKSETVTGIKPANATQKSTDNTPGCGIDTAGEGVKYITGARGLVSGNITVDANGSVYSTLHLHGPDFNYYKEGIVHQTSDWAGVYAGKMIPGGKFAWLIPLYSYDGNGGIPLGSIPFNSDDQTFYTLPSTTTDAMGNFFVLYFVNHDNGYGEVPSVFLSKYNNAGTLLWTIKQNEGFGFNESLFATGAIKTDAAGNVYLSGNYSAFTLSGSPAQENLVPSPINFDPSNATSHTLSGTGSFTLKLDANGNFVSVTQSNYTLRNFAVDDHQQIYDTGLLITPPPPATGKTFEDYVLKIGTDGHLLWRKSLGFFNGSAQLTLDNKGNAILWGIHPFQPTRSGIALFNSSGTIKWRNLDVPTFTVVTTDALGNIYTIGTFSGTVNFSPNGGTYNLTAGAQSAIFIMKFSTTGQLVWVKQRPVQNATNISTAIDSKFLYLQGNTSPTTIFGAKVSLCN